MARQETDKEDLIRDATALVERAEIICEEWSTIITIGFFRDGRCAVYIDQDPFYQFDSSGLLRRAFESGFLYRSQGSTLAQINRRRSTSKNSETETVVLCRNDLSVSELHQFRERMTLHLNRLHNSIELGKYSVCRAVTSDGKIPARTLPMLNAVLQHGSEFVAPPVVGR